MHHITHMFKYLLLFITFFAFAQKPTLYKMSFKELSDLYFKEKDTLCKIQIADFFLHKAKKEQFHFNIVLGYIYKSQIEKNDDLVEKYIDSTVSHSEKYMPNTYLLSYSYYTKANYFFDKRKYNTALNNYILADKLLNKADNESLYYDIQFSIAIINSSLLNYKEALPVFLEYHNYYLKTYNEPSLGAVFSVAESYNRLGNIKLAKYYTSYGKKWSKMLNHDQEVFMYSEGIDYFKEKKYNKAIQILKNSLTLLATKKDFANYATNSFYIAKSYLAIGNKRDAMLFFKKVDSVFDAKNNITLERIDCYKYLIQHYKDNKDINNQLYYTEKLIKADSTLRSNYEYLTTKIHKDYNIPKLLKNKESLIDQLKNEKLYFTVFVGFLLIISFGLVTTFIRYRKRQNQLLINQQLAFEKYKENQHEKIINIDLEKNTDLKQIETANVIQDGLIDVIMGKLVLFEKGEQYLNKECTLDKLAKDLDTNTSYLSKIINDKKKTSFPNYLNSLRIEYAVLKLENDDLFRKYNMKGIADSVGFNNADSFSRAFKHHMNMNPTFFIDKLKNK